MDDPQENQPELKVPSFQVASASSEKTTSRNTILLISIIVVLVLGIGTGIYLISTQEEVASPQRAAVIPTQFVVPSPTKTPTPLPTEIPSPTQGLLTLQQTLTPTEEPAVQPELSPTEIIVGQSQVTPEITTTTAPTEVPTVPPAGTSAGVFFIAVAGIILVTLMLVF